MPPRAAGRMATGAATGGAPASAALVAEPYADLADARERLAALWRAFEARGDPRADFLGVYVETTEAVASRIERAAFAHPDWVADYLVAFANRYREAVRLEEAGERSALPEPWRVAFAETDPAAPAVRNAALGVNAHINYDLALALETVGVDGDRAARHADHRAVTEAIAEVLSDAWDWLTARDAASRRGAGEALDGPGADLALATIHACRERAWRSAVAMADGGGLRRRAARFANDAGSRIGAAVVATWG